MRWLVLGCVLLHAAVLLGHDAAHRSLGVELVTWQTVYAYGVIVAAPLVAAGLVFGSHARSGFLLLAIAMAGSLAFSVYHHYVGISPDHVRTPSARRRTGALQADGVADGRGRGPRRGSRCLRVREKAGPLRPGA